MTLPNNDEENHDLYKTEARSDAVPQQTPRLYQLHLLLEVEKT